MVGHEFPSMLDHILLGCSDLDEGVAFVEQHTGVRAGIGGVHPGRGTRNALLSLGPRRYLEIIAPDPAQKGISSSRLKVIEQLKTPRLIGWAVHVNDINTAVNKLRESGVKYEEPESGSRRRPNGRMCNGRALVSSMIGMDCCRFLSSGEQERFTRRWMRARVADWRSLL